MTPSYSFIVFVIYSESENANQSKIMSCFIASNPFVASDSTANFILHYYADKGYSLLRNGIDGFNFGLFKPDAEKTKNFIFCTFSHQLVDLWTHLLVVEAQQFFSSNPIDQMSKLGAFIGYFVGLFQPYSAKDERIFSICDCYQDGSEPFEFALLSSVQLTLNSYLENQRLCNCAMEQSHQDC